MALVSSQALLSVLWSLWGHISCDCLGLLPFRSYQTPALQGTGVNELRLSVYQHIYFKATLDLLSILHLKLNYSMGMRTY